MLMRPRTATRGRKASPDGGGSGARKMMTEAAMQKTAPLAATIWTTLAMLRGFFMQNAPIGAFTITKGKTVDPKKIEECRHEVKYLCHMLDLLHQENNAELRGDIGAKIAIVQNKTMKLLKAAKAADTKE